MSPPYCPEVLAAWHTVKFGLCSSSSCVRLLGPRYVGVLPSIPPAVKFKEQYNPRHPRAARVMPWDGPSKALGTQELACPENLIRVYCEVEVSVITKVPV